MRYVSVRDFKGKVLIDIREYWMNPDGEMKPGKKGTGACLRSLSVLTRWGEAYRPVVSPAALTERLLHSRRSQKCLWHLNGLWLVRGAAANEWLSLGALQPDWFLTWTLRQASPSTRSSGTSWRTRSQTSTTPSRKSNDSLVFDC